MTNQTTEQERALGRAQFEKVFPFAVWSEEKQNYTEPEYAFAYTGWIHGRAELRAEQNAAEALRTAQDGAREPVALSRDEFHDKAWALYHAKTFDDTQLAKVNIHTIRAVFNAVYDACPSPQNAADASKPRIEKFACAILAQAAPIDRVLALANIAYNRGHERIGFPRDEMLAAWNRLQAEQVSTVCKESLPTQEPPTVKDSLTTQAPSIPDNIERRTNDIRMRLANPTSIPRSALLHYTECLLAHIALLRPAALSAQVQPTSEDAATTLYIAATSCSHSIDSEAVVLRRDPKKPGNALSQLADRLGAAYAACMGYRALP